MENDLLSPHLALSLRIKQLQEDNLRQSETINRLVNELAISFQPVNAALQKLHSMAEQPSAPIELAKLGLNAGLNFLIDQLLGKHRSIKGYLSAIQAESISEKFVNTNAPGLIGLLGAYLKKRLTPNINNTNES
ncbi:MAG: hypothetical protein PSX36_04610 [bacterium]|nr:hypothetical protein [bacterium]